MPHWEKVISERPSGTSLRQRKGQANPVMNAVMQETATPVIAATTREAQSEFSQEYSRGELEEMDSRELLDGYAE